MRTGSERGWIVGAAAVGSVGGFCITDGASECQGQAVHFFASVCVRVHARARIRYLST